MTSHIEEIRQQQAEPAKKVSKAILPLLILIFLAALIDGIDQSIVSVAMPTLCNSLGITLSNGSWIVLGYMLGIASLMIPFGKMAKNGRIKKFFISGTALMAIGSMGSAIMVISGNFELMICLRVIQGIGAAMFCASIPCIIVHDLPSDMKGTGMAAMGAASGVSLIIAPLSGGVIATFYCPAVFMITPILAVVLIILQLKVMPADEAPDKSKDPTLMGGIATMFCIGSILLILENIGNAGVAQYAMVACAVIIVVSIVVLYRSILRDESRAVISPAMLKNRDYLLICAAFVACTIMLAGTQYVLPFFLEVSMGFESWKSGMFLTISSVILVIIVLPVGRYVDKHGAKSVSVGAQVCRIIVCAILALIQWQNFGELMTMILIVIMLLIYGCSQAFSGTGQTTRAIHHATKGYEDESTNFILTLNYTAYALGTVIYALVISLTVPESIGINIEDFTEAIMDAAARNTAIFGMIMCIIGLICALVVKNKIPKHDE